MRTLTLRRNDIAAWSDTTPFVLPEFFSTTPNGINDSDFTILGGKEEDVDYTQQILQTCKNGNHKFIHATYKEAELVKYMINSFLAMKVSFCSQFWKLSDQLGIKYERLRELFILDPRVGCSHTFIDNEHPYWSSHCFDKDIPAIASLDGTELLRSMIQFNDYMKNSSKK